MIAVEVRHATALTWSQEEDEEDDEEEEEEKEETTAHIKSNNPHLTGGEQYGTVQISKKHPISAIPKPVSYKDQSPSSTVSPTRPRPTGFGYKFLHVPSFNISENKNSFFSSFSTKNSRTFARQFS